MSHHPSKRRGTAPWISVFASEHQFINGAHWKRSPFACLSIVVVATAILLGDHQLSLARCIVPQPPERLATEDVEYTDLNSIRKVDPRNVPDALVDFEATVTFVDAMREFLFVQNDQDAIFVFRPDFGNIEPGQRVRVRGGLAEGDLLPIVSDPIVTLIGDGDLPIPEKTSVIGVEHDCRYLNFEFDILQTISSVEETTLYAKTESNQDVYIKILHPDGTILPNFSGRRIQCSGILGLQMREGVFLKPGVIENRIVGYKVFCNSPDDLKVIGKDQSTDAESAKMIGLSFLERDAFPAGRFLTFAQICLIDESEQPEFVVYDGIATVRLSLPSSLGLQPGMIMRIGGEKSTDQSGRPRFDIDYLRYINLSALPQPKPTSVQHAVETFTPNRRITVEGVPKSVEHRDGKPHLILREGKSTIAVYFQDAVADSIASLEPCIAQKVSITGVSKSDDECDFQIVVVRPDDVQLLEKKTSLSRMVAIGLGALLAVCALAALWIKLLRAQVAQKERFESIFDNAGCPIIVFDGNLQIDHANQVAADMLLYSKAELRKMGVKQIDPEIPVDQVMAMLAETMRTQEVAVFPTTVLTRDKKVLDVEVHCRNLLKSADPNKARHIAIFPDVTARIQHANELKEARDEAVKANKAKSRFVASMSHELRTPLNGVIGMTQLLESTELTPTQADYLAACRTSGETLLTVIGDVLDFSKMEAGKLELEPQKTELIPFVENVVRATSLQQGTRHVDLASFVDPRLSRSVMVDSDRLRQVMFNLIGNAAKFTTKGSIIVTAKCGEVTDQYADVRFVVSDTGVGIPKDSIAGLFKPFEQLDSSTTRQYGGTGLGLTICKQIVELMGGQIHAESVEGKGSDFIVDVRLPFAAESVNESERETNFISNHGRVAVVGTSEPVSELLSEMFAAYEVEASFFDDTDVLPTGEFEVVLLNSQGDLDAVTAFINRQTALSSDDGPALIPLIPTNRTIKLQQWELLGTEQPIPKPFAQTRLLQPVNSVSDDRNQPVSDELPSAQLPDHPLRILICEDNRINQKFAKAICKQASIEVVVCDNGQDGIDMLKLDAQFDAVFMDCHMPVMDGFKASRKIREMTKEGSIPKIPVIALTANALAGDREKCLDAGMDDYLTKPFTIEQLLDKIRIHTITTSESSSVTESTSSSAADIYNHEKLREQFQDDVFALELAGEFAKSLPEYDVDFRSGLEEKDARQIFETAHRLKGSAGTVMAERIENVASEIESAARDGQLEMIESQLKEILLEFDNFANVINEQKFA